MRKPSPDEFEAHRPFIDLARDRALEADHLKAEADFETRYQERLAAHLRSIAASGGKAKAARQTPDQRAASARAAATERWRKYRMAQSLIDGSFETGANETTQVRTAERRTAQRRTHKPKL